MVDEELILGLDIGGANTKAALIAYKDKHIIQSSSFLEYFPFWEQNLKNLDELFQRIIAYFKFTSEMLQSLSIIAITITAELSDAFQTKREGILTLLKVLRKVFDEEKLAFISTENRFVKLEHVKKNPLSIAAANWVSTSMFLGKFEPNCILIDAGSTTIDLIPIVNSKPATIGKDDLNRLLNHELIYTGGLRATIPSITHFVPYRGNRVRISFEKFALISDVHLILENISEDEYLNDTADNRSTSMDDCFARLSRIICSDLDAISKEELITIANYIYEKQLTLIKEEIEIFMINLTNRHPQFKRKPLIVITGLSANFLIKPCLETLRLKHVKTLEEITQIPNNTSSSAFAVAGAFHFYGY